MINRQLMCLLVSLFTWTVPSASERAHDSICAKPLSDQEVVKIFKQNTLKQLALEFGDAGIFVYDIEPFAIDNVLLRVEAFAKYPRPGQKQLATMRVTGWVSRCQGTTIIRGNTWLADGGLMVPRYAGEKMEGKGLQWGKADAPMRFIVYVDSRCPHCHRLISYARELVESGKVFLDVRQVAYLEDVDAAITDTRLLETSLVLGDAKTVADDAYLELLNGFANETPVNTSGTDYKSAMEIIKTNTSTAKGILRIITVPAVFVQEPEHNHQYRQMGYWEINRIFQ